MFVIQRLLERDGKFTLMDQNRVLRPHPFFRLFAPPTPSAWAT
ncbi:Aerobic cobaltochelatase CobS subunit [Polaromonas sp. CG9_12]|nr:Aerobic cobaltochelatase CobS subunit [Polaromonas sp. CG9_12]